MAVRVAVNGMGAIGRDFVRALYHGMQDGWLAPGGISVVAANDLYPAAAIAKLLEHDSVYGKFPGKVEVAGDDLFVDGTKIRFSAERTPSLLHWDELDVDIVYDATGAWVKPPKDVGKKDPAKAAELERYLEKRTGAKALLFSAPTDNAEFTMVHGVNHEEYTGQRLVSTGSCTTNCLAPLLKALMDEYGPFTGYMVTTHAMTNDQRLLDEPHGGDLARGYSAPLNIIPTSTGAAKAIGKVLPEFEGKLDGYALRVPVATVSALSLFANLPAHATKNGIHAAIKTGAQRMKGTMEYRDGPLVSTMVVGERVPCVVDGSQTKAAGNGALLLAWYDNVRGFCCQSLLDVLDIGGFLERGFHAREQE